MSDKTDKELTLEYLEKLRLSAYTSFNDRRSYEWKLALAIWTALAVLLAGLVQPTEATKIFPFHGHKYGVIALTLGVAILLVQIYFNNGMARANGIDKAKALLYEKQIESMLDLKVDPALADDLKRRILSLPAQPHHRLGQWRQWGHLAQITISAILTFAAVALVWVRATR